MPAIPALRQGRGKTKSQAQIDDEARQVFEMVLSGMRHDQIAEALQISHGTVSARRKRGGELAVVPAVEEYRREASARLDATLNALLSDSPKMTPRVVEAIVAIETRRAKLYGIDSPIQIEQTITTVEGGIDAEVQRLAAGLGLQEETRHGSEATVEG